MNSLQRMEKKEKLPITTVISSTGISGPLWEERRLRWETSALTADI